MFLARREVSYCLCVATSFYLVGAFFFEIPRSAVHMEENLFGGCILAANSLFSEPPETQQVLRLYIKHSVR
jgi:hypothetical protein